jgi:hypothetical protein
VHILVPNAALLGRDETELAPLLQLLLLHEGAKDRIKYISSLPTAVIDTNDTLIVDEADSLLLDEPFKFWQIAKECRILCFTATGDTHADDKETAIFNRIKFRSISYGQATKQITHDD